MKHQVFISYAGENKETAFSLCEKLEEENITCWIAPRNVGIGDFATAIVNAIKNCQIFIVIISQDSCKSTHVFREIKLATESVGIIIPLKIDEIPVPETVEYYLKPYQWFDLSEEISYEQLIINIKQVITQDNIFIERVEDYSSPDILKALELYVKRIPENERFESSDIVRWLREDVKKTRDYFFIAKENDEIRGFTLIHYNPARQLAFIAYLVRKEKLKMSDPNIVTAQLFKKISGFYIGSSELKDCKAFLMEVDDPRFANSEKERNNRIARIRLFSMVAQQSRFHLRALGFEYKQPLLFIPKTEQKGSEQSMMLLYASSQMPAFLKKEEVLSLLDFVYNWLYPESFSEIPEENENYKAYLNEFFNIQINSLPDRVEVLNLHQIIELSEN
jgi:hypothetical protein